MTVVNVIKQEWSKLLMSVLATIGMVIMAVIIIISAWIACIGSVILLAGYADKISIPGRIILAVSMLIVIVSFSILEHYYT